MSYMHIDNLYKNQDILLFKECYAMEKIHGTSAHISWKHSKLNFFAGGVSYEGFVKLFLPEDLIASFEELNYNDITIFGEAYGGKCQGMSETYGKNLRFVAFEVKIEDSWFSVPKAEDIVLSLNLDFVPYVKCSTEIETLNYWRDYPSVQSLKNGIKEERKREGIVIRPLIELVKNNGKRIIAKHKADDFRETKTPRKVSKDDLGIKIKAQEIADEWVTPMRLNHILQNFISPEIEQLGEIIKLMIEDVEREAEGEIITSPLVRKAIASKTALMFKDMLKSRIK